MHACMVKRRNNLHVTIEKRQFGFFFVDGKAQADFTKHYIKQKLEHGFSRIWQDVQSKVKIYVLGTDLSGFKLEEFIRVLDLVNR